MITEPGIYKIPAVEYHADPCPAPSASRGFLQKLVSATPLHAFIEHPRLNPNFIPEDNKDFDFGSAAHDYLLEGGEKVVVLNFPDYRTSAAKAERDAVVAMGKLPILQCKFDKVESMVKAFREQIECHAQFKDAFKSGKAEQSIIWSEDGTWFRSMPDFIADDGWIDDYKTTEMTGGPDRWINGVFFDKGYDLQAYMAMRGYYKITGQRAKGFRFWVQEVDSPHSVYCVVPSELTHDIAEQKFFHGKMIFEKCLKSGRWPGYKNTAYVADPTFMANKRYEDIKVQRQEIDQNEGELMRIMTDWQSPLERKA